MLCAAREMHLRRRMATTRFPNLHTRAGARWLAPFLVALLVVLGMGYLMLIYPHVG